MHRPSAALDPAPLEPAHPMRANGDLGAVVFWDSGTAFRIYAPLAASVRLAGSFNNWHTSMLHAEGGGYFSGYVAGVTHGEYKYVIALAPPKPSDAARMPEHTWINDPCGRELRRRGSILPPDYNDVISRSRPSYPLPSPDGRWTGITAGTGTPAANHVMVDPATAIIYEAHVGGAAPDGADFDALCARLPYIAATGANVLQLMPVAFDISGGVDARQAPVVGWGYGPGSQSHVNPAFGSWASLRRLVDAAHARGMAVIVDVVPNHMHDATCLLLQPDKALVAAMQGGHHAPEPASPTSGSRRTAAFRPPDSAAGKKWAAGGGASRASTDASAYALTGQPSCRRLPPNLAEHIRGRSYFYVDSRFNTPWGGGRLDLTNQAVRSWLTRCLLAWVVEAGVDGFRVDSIGTLTYAAADETNQPSRDMRRMLPEAWEFLAELTDAVRAVHHGALLTAEDMQSDFRVVDIAGFDADWSSEGVHKLRNALLRAGPASLRRPAPERSPLSDLAAFALRSLRGHAPCARVIYTHNHDESPSDRVGALVSQLWDAAGVKPGEAERRTLAVLGRDGSFPEPIALAVLAHAFIALGCPGIVLLGQGEEVAAASSLPWPVPPSLASRWPCPPPGSAAFANLVAYGALHALRAQLLALAGGPVTVQHVNDSGDDRVIVLTRFAASRRVTDRDAPPPPVRLGSIVTDGAEAVLLFNFGPRRYKSGYRCGAPRAGFWAPVLDTGMLLRSVLPQLLAHLGAVEGGARDGGNGRVVDAARADLADAISRALVGLRPRTPDGVAAIALDAMQTMLSEAHKAGPPYAPWCWGGQTLAERGCYGDGNEGFPFSILCERLEPFSARVYVRVSPCPPAAAAVDGSGSGSPRSALQWSCVSCTLRNESDAAACAVCLLPRP
jgi:1,4-alpha-glucan branching enzyme